MAWEINKLKYLLLQNTCSQQLKREKQQKLAFLKYDREFKKLIKN